MAKVLLPKDNSGFQYGYEWLCQSEGCNAAPEGAPPRPARLFIRSKVDKVDAVSNFDFKRQSTDPLGRWTKQQPSELNWQGMAEERGWRTAPHVVCPACQVGMNVIEYKRAGNKTIPVESVSESAPSLTESTKTSWVHKLFSKD